MDLNGKNGSPTAEWTVAEPAAGCPPRPAGNKLVFLESIRGLAALSVVIFHLLLAFAPMLTVYSPEYSPPASTVALVRLFTNGPLAVSIFFILSGFVLSLSFFQTRDRARVTSAALRRYFRLAVPTAIVTVAAWLLLRLGCCFNHQAAALMPFDWSDSRQWMYDFTETRPFSFFAAVRQALFDDFFAFNAHTCLDPVLWTMPRELAGSFLVFAILALFGTLRRRWLIYVLGALIVPHAWAIEFLGGMALCDFYVNRPARLNLQPWIAFPALALAFLLGTGGDFWLAKPVGLPPGGNTRTAEVLAALIAPLLIVAGITFTPLLRRLLSTRPLAFLGRISFGLYIVHFPIILSLGCWLYVTLRRFGQSHPGAALQSSLACIAASLFMGWIFHHIADKPGIRLGRWVEKLFTSQ